MTISQMPWTLWRSQVRAVLRLEMKKNFLSRRGLWIYLLALAPVLLFSLHSLFMIKEGRTGDFGQDTHAFAFVFQFLFLRLVIFFGCVGIFMNLFRGEVLEKSLHYYFLAPIRREVLLAGKYLSGLFGAALIFSASTLLQLIALYWCIDASALHEYFSRGPGFAQVAAYLGVTVLACIGYGSIFLAAGVLFRNPLIPAFVVLIWEAINGFLPPVLQKISVIFYLKSLCPVEMPAGALAGPGNPLALIAFAADAPPAWIAILGPLLLSLSFLAVASLWLRRMEINYGTE